MANTVRPCGARPKGVARRANVYVSGGIVYPGDWVKMNSSGQMVAGTATAALSGVSASYASASGQQIVVYDHPDQEFIVQASGSQPAAQSDILFNYDIVATGGSAAFKCSRMALLSAAGSATATLPLKLLAIDSRPDNALGANSDCVVIINNHQLKGGTGTAGV